MKKYKLVNSRPVARFYYKGSHSHPVQRTVLIIESTDTYIRGYEVREGKLTREVADAPIKSYKRSKIARNKNLRLEQRVSYFTITGRNTEVTTLKRGALFDYLFTGP